MTRRMNADQKKKQKLFLFMIRVHPRHPRLGSSSGVSVAPW
jgi:hypothetical protein